MLLRGPAPYSGFLRNSEKIIRDHYFNVMTEEEAAAFWAIRPA
jgi:hypothetical protein